eukprot:5554880-Heterocapsa_arctica.AAC.1
MGGLPVAATVHRRLRAIRAPSGGRTTGARMASAVRRRGRRPAACSLAGTLASDAARMERCL